MDDESPSDGSPTLEVGFAINPEYGELAQLQGMMTSTEVQVVAEAAKIERATGGMVKLGGATAQMTSFGNAATAELAKAERASGRAEKAGEGLSRQMERQIAHLRHEPGRGGRARSRANGLTELAERLRSQEAALAQMREQATAALRAEAQAAERLAQEQAD